eukprot:NODE_35_length_36362_cov_0.944434.p34 type:complete len:105 gc:universal NODE_35_length_36362_cov_0.944434:10785-10471(-)
MTLAAKIVLPTISNQECSLLNRPQELRELLRMNKFLIKVDDRILYSPRENICDKKWLAIISIYLTPTEVARFKQIIGWQEQNSTYCRISRKSFSYSDLVGHKSK